MTSYPSDRAEAYGAYERERARQEEAQAAGGSISELLSGLIADAQNLARREIDLARREIANEVSKVRQGAIFMGAGVASATIGGILLGHMLAHLLQDAFGIALWISYLVVGGLLAIAGVILLRQGTARMSTVDPVPHETIESVRKDVEWITQQSQSDKT
ncbi:MAG TPA: phage holin family protein [Roseiflexaceae bacterium]|nr:phage holin family protein [Roseiflexaceae bacterium]